MSFDDHVIAIERELGKVKHASAEGRTPAVLNALDAILLHAGKAFDMAGEMHAKIRPQG